MSVLLFDERFKFRNRHGLVEIIALDHVTAAFGNKLHLFFCFYTLGDSLQLQIARKTEYSRYYRFIFGGHLVALEEFSVDLEHIYRKHLYKVQ